VLSTRHNIRQTEEPVTPESLRQKGKGKETYSSLQAGLRSLLRELIIWDHTALPCFTPAEAGTRFSDPGEMQG